MKSKNSTLFMARAMRFKAFPCLSRQGQIVSLLGRNGMGKSTTLKSVMGLTKPRSGVILFNGKQIFGLPPYKIAMAGIGYVPEERRIFPTLSVIDNLLLGLKGGRPDTKNPNSWTLEQNFSTFSGLEIESQQQRVRIFQAVSSKCSLSGDPLWEILHFCS